MSRDAVVPARIERDIEAIAACSQPATTAGYHRATFSPGWARACDYVLSKAGRLGCRSRRDAHGNLRIRPGGVSWSDRVWLCGSHLDSVPTGGKYDGVSGVVCALELLRIGVPLELVVFAEEEGTGFGTALLGSRSWVGTVSASDLSRMQNDEGRSFLEAGAAFGVDASAMNGDRLAAERYLGFVEVHPEQGASLWKQGRPIGLVTTVNGRRQFRVIMAGRSNHAGSTQMLDRHDALAGAAQAIIEIERIALDLAVESPYTVATVGRIDVGPNEINVIANSATFTVDLRAQTPGSLSRADDLVKKALQEICARRGLGLVIESIEDLPPIPMEETVIDRLEHACVALGLTVPRVPSGALHDAGIVAPYLPAAMIFVASRDGVSHDPAEYTRVEDIALAVRVIAGMLREEEPGPVTKTSR